MHLYKRTESLAFVSATLKAAGEPSRLRILKVLEQGELCVCHLVSLLGLSQPTVSRHLSVLRAAGLIEERKEGRWSHYRLAPAAPFPRRLLETLRGWGEDDPAVRSDRERAETFREVPVSEFCASRRSRDR